MTLENQLFFIAPNLTLSEEQNRQHNSSNTTHNRFGTWQPTQNTEDAKPNNSTITTTARKPTVVSSRSRYGLFADLTIRRTY